MCWKFPSLLRDAPDIHRFVVKTRFLWDDLLTSEPSLGILQKFQCRPYNCAVLFLRHIGYSFLFLQILLKLHYFLNVESVSQWLK